MSCVLFVEPFTFPAQITTTPFRVLGVRTALWLLFDLWRFLPLAVFSHVHGVRFGTPLAPASPHVVLSSPCMVVFSPIFRYSVCTGDAPAPVVVVPESCSVSNPWDIAHQVFIPHTEVVLSIEPIFHQATSRISCACAQAFRGTVHRPFDPLANPAPDVPRLRSSLSDRARVGTGEGTCRHRLCGCSATLPSSFPEEVFL